MVGKIAGALVLASACSCTSPQNARYDRPPPPRDEVVEVRAGYFWVHGHWERQGSRWIWRAGHDERERPGYEYVEGRWEPSDGYYIWIEGSWRPIAHGSAAQP